MTTSNLIRMGGPAAILGGVLFSVMWVIDEFVKSGTLSETFFESRWSHYIFWVPSMALLAVGVAGLYLHQSRRFGKLGKAGFYLSLAGFSVGAIGGLAMILVDLVIGNDSMPFLLFVITHLLACAMFLIGSLIFGVATYRARALPRGGALLLIVGAPGLFPFPPAGLVLLGGGWAWLGYALFFSDRSMVPAQQEESSGIRTEGLLLSVTTRAVAVLLGVIPTFVLFAGVFSDAAGLLLYFLAHMGIAAVLYAALGVAFGLAIPRPAWRWGLWLSVPTLSSS